MFEKYFYLKLISVLKTYIEICFIQQIFIYFITKKNLVLYFELKFEK